MATAIVESPTVTETTTTVTHTPGREVALAPTQRRPLARALVTVVACIAVVWVGVTALLLVLTDTSVVAALGTGAYASFWLGGGFGAIFGSAAAFAGDH